MQALKYEPKEYQSDKQKLEEKLKAAKSLDEEDKIYFQYPLFLLRDLLTDKHKCLDNIINYGVYAFANSFEIDPYYLAERTLYKYFRKKDELPEGIIKKLDAYDAKGEINLKDNEYCGFGAFGEFRPYDEVDELISIFTNDEPFNNEVYEWYKVVNVFEKFKIDGDYKFCYLQGKKIAQTIPAKEPIPMMNKDKLFEYRDNDKSDYELLKFAVVLAMRSILGKSDVIFTNKDMIFSRAFGYKDIKLLQANKDKIGHYYELYFDKRKPEKVRYHTNKILDEIEIENHNLFKYSNNRMRGIFIAKKRKTTIKKVMEIAKERSKKIKIKEMKDHKREIEKQVFGRLNKQQPNYNQCKDDATT